MSQLSEQHESFSATSAGRTVTGSFAVTEEQQSRQDTLSATFLNRLSPEDLKELLQAEQFKRYHCERKVQMLERKILGKLPVYST